MSELNFETYSPSEQCPLILRLILPFRRNCRDLEESFLDPNRPGNFALPLRAD